MSGKSRPGQIFYATATKQVNHNLPVIESNVPGVAVKTAAPAATATPATTPVISVSEKFSIVRKGVVQVVNTGSGVSAATKGTAIQIIVASNLLTTAAVGAGIVRYGRVHEVAGERGCPTGFVRIDLDDKDA